MATTTSPGVDPSIGEWPGAGACGRADDKTHLGTVGIGRDLVAEPRCMIVLHGQGVRVVNGTSMTLKTRLGTRLRATVLPGGSVTFAKSIDNYLAPGDHLLVLTAASAAEIWVDPICNGPLGSDCRPRGA